MTRISGSKSTVWGESNQISLASLTKFDKYVTTRSWLNLTRVFWYFYTALHAGNTTKSVQRIFVNLPRSSRQRTLLCTVLGIWLWSFIVSQNYCGVAGTNVSNEMPNKGVKRHVSWLRTLQALKQTEQNIIRPFWRSCWSIYGTFKRTMLDFTPPLPGFSTRPLHVYL